MEINVRGPLKTGVSERWHHNWFDCYDRWKFGVSMQYTNKVVRAKANIQPFLVSFVEFSRSVQDLHVINSAVKWAATAAHSDVHGPCVLIHLSF